MEKGVLLIAGITLWLLQVNARGPPPPSINIAQCLSTNLLFRVVVTPTSAIVDALNDVTLTCLPTSPLNMPSQHSWFRINGDIPSSASGRNTNTLTLHDVVLADEGEYYCIALRLGHCARSNNVMVSVRAVTVSFNQSSYTINEGGGPIQPVLVLSDISSIDVEIIVKDVKKSAARDIDYVSGPYTVTIPAGQTHSTLNISVIDDGIPESNEFFLLVIVDPSNNKFKRGKLRRIAVTILDDEANIVTQPSNTSAAAPFSGVFTCCVSGYGHQNITWYRRSDSLPPKHRIIVKTKSQGVITSSLIIPNVTETDVGEYYCQLWVNNLGVRSNAAHLHHSGTPEKPTMEVLPGQQIELTVNNLTLLMKCLSHNIVNVNFKWEKKDSRLPLKAEGVYSERLIITELSPEDSGEYRCVVINSTGMMTSDYLLVTIKVGLPKIVRQPRSTLVEIYGVAKFSCTIKSYGSFSVTWRRQNSDLPVTADVSTTRSVNETKSILRITKSIGYYKGYYYCVITNKVGTVISRYAYCNVTVPCPQMIVPPKSVIVRPDITVTFSCLAWSFGMLVYSWSRNGISTLPTNNSILYQDKSFPADTNYLTNMYELKILNVQAIDEGLYCCEASNECGTNKTCAWLEINTSPVITVQPKSQTFKVEERNVLAFWILTTGVGPTYYEWKKFDPFINSWISPSGRAKSIKSSNLTFSVITEEDQGIYHCIIRNDDGYVISDDANLTVYGSPIITYISSGIIAFEGSKVNLVCNSTNDGDAIDPVQISWYNGTKLLNSGGKHVVIYSKHDNITDQRCSVLVLDSVNITDDGEYFCRAFNDPLCYAERKTKLTVEYTPRVTIDPPESPYMVSVGDRALLYCIAEGFPIPTIQWYENNVLIPRQSSPFYLVSTSVPHTKVYTCEGKNNAGNMENIAQASITVVVVKKIKCPTLSDPINGKVFIISNGKAAIFTCNSGFIVVGNSYIECKGRKWSSLPPICQDA